MNEEDRKKYFNDFVKDQLEADNKTKAENYQRAKIKLEPTEYNQLIYFEAIFFRMYSRELNKKIKKNINYKMTKEDYIAIFEEAYNKSNLEERDQEKYERA